jgi:hypothetical protein
VTPDERHREGVVHARSERWGAAAASFLWAGADWMRAAERDALHAVEFRRRAARAYRDAARAALEASINAEYPAPVVPVVRA